MEFTKDILHLLYDHISFRSLFTFVGLGILAGLAIGLILISVLQKGKFLFRQNKFHHGFLKIYFLVFPLFFGYIGFHLGTIYSFQHDVHAGIDAHKPELALLTSGLLKDFQSFMDEEVKSGIDLKKMSAEDFLNAVVDDYLKKHPIEIGNSDVKGKFLSRVAEKGLTFVKSEMIKNAFKEKIVESSSSATHLEPEMVKEIIETDIGKLFSAEFLTDLMKKQIDKLFKNFYIGTLILFATFSLVVIAEFVISKYLIYRAKPKEEYKLMENNIKF